MKKSLLLGRTFPAACAVLALLHSASAVTFESSFVGPNNGVWSNAANWSPNSVPNNGGGNLYNVTVGQDVIARLDIDVTINNLTLGASSGRVFGTDHNLTMTGTTSMGAGNRLDVVSSSAAAVKFNLNNLANFSGTTLNSGGYFVTAATGTTSQLQFNGANIVTNSARIGLIGAGASIIDQNGNNALANLTTNTDTGFIRFGSGYNFTTSNNFENQGYMVVRPGSTATFNGSFTATETGAPDSGLIEIFGTSSGPSFTQGNGAVAVNGSFTNVNAAGDTLTGGQYSMLSNGTATATLRFNNANIINNAASIVLTGPNSQILDQNGLDGMRNIASNSGFLLISRQTRSTSGALANSGVLAFLGGANVTIGGGLSNDGFLGVLPFDDYLHIGGVPGFDPAPDGALTTLVTVNGNLSLTSNSDVYFEIFDPTITASMRVNGLAAFDGILELVLFDPSLLTSTDSLTLILTDGPITGSFANVLSGGRLDATQDTETGGTGDVVGSFRVDYNGNSLTITDFQPAGAVPEPGTWALVVVGGFGLALYQRRALVRRT
ncbi:MAG: hypothetical protein ACR2ID_08400 [Chthoniobacterales bacterium]